MSESDLPADHPQIRKVSSFEELVGTPFREGVNALCWERTLEGDFAEVAKLLAVRPGIIPIEDEQLSRLSVSAKGREAVQSLLEDIRLLRELGVEPVLDCITGHPREVCSAPIPTDVYSFHADSATEQMDTYLCTYVGASSEGLRNEEARRWVDVPEMRARLLQEFGGADDDAFLEYLEDHYFDLHYAPLADARPYSFGLYNLWRIAVVYPGSPVPPCVHRAPQTLPGDAPRLLLIS